MRILQRLGARSPVVIMVLTAITNGIILGSQQRLLVLAAGFVLLCLLPGFLLTRALRVERVCSSELETVALMCGLGFSALILGTLGLHYLPGPLTPSHFLVFFDALILLLIVLTSRQAGASPATRSQSRFHLIVVALILLASFFRLANLGYSDFQGDEARAMLMGAGAIRGEDSILFLHRKGPAEILVPTAFYALDGTTSELIARLPFALANLAGLLSVCLLAQRLFPDRRIVAFGTLAVAAVDGYLIAFSRIVQYQSLVILMTALSAWCAYVWFETRTPSLLSLSGLFLSIGTLAHYEAILVTPFIAWLIVTRARQDSWTVGQWVQGSIGPVLTFLLVAGFFYGPFILHPHFKLTAEYLTSERIGGSLLYNNLGDFFWRATFYNSTYYVILLILSVVMLTVWEVEKIPHSRPAGFALAAVCFIGLATAAFFPDVPVVGDLNLAILPFFTVLGLVLASPRTSTEVKAVLLWFGVSSLALFFLTRKPKNHGYLLSMPWAILVGVVLSRGAVALSKRFKRPGVREHLQRAALAGGSLLVFLFAYYEYIVFVRHRPNFLLDYPEARPALYASVHGDELPRVGFFGFPHRSGLKAAGALQSQGVIQGSYHANAEPLITSWYTRKMAWCPGSADFYLITTPIQDSEPLPVEVVREEHDLLARVWSGGEVVLGIYSQQPAEAVTQYDFREVESLFDASTGVDAWLWALRSPVPQQDVDASLGGVARVLGYDAPRRVTAGERLPLMLYWQPTDTIDHHYNVFVHVEVPGGRIWAQSDGTPGCGSEPTTDWEPAATIVDGHSLSLDPLTPPGEYPLLVGLYDPMTGERLPVTGGNANPYGNAVVLGTVEVIAPPSAHGEEDRL